MAEPRIARLYLYPDLRRRVEAGRRGFLTSLVDLLRGDGWEVYLRNDTPEELHEARTRSGYSLVRMITPPNRRGLTFRRTYFAPFWHIERVAERWDWPVAKTPFDPKTVQPHKALRFLNTMRHRHFHGARLSRDGFALVPLQGRLLERRSFQSCSPIQMLQTLLEHEPSRQVHATLHPKERYTPQEIGALDRLAASPRFSYGTGETDRLLPACDYVATMNSATALHGYFLEKPAVLFGKIDFHHIASNVSELGAAEAISRAAQQTPDYAAYLWWFFRDMAIDDSRPDAPARIQAALKAGGWPV
ncbi:hypothetical protein [Pacificoceanicola onchidii]|uniref:hypothetical protein n=1 Tax=Pacificoceanicola onchidii TaxID=2562685 RepID=UPI0010A5B9F1|nr:hypothetical protein [Pacificoceanicola onchidii]